MEGVRDGIIEMQALYDLDDLDVSHVVHVMDVMYLNLNLAKHVSNWLDCPVWNANKLEMCIMAIMDDLDVLLYSMYWHWVECWSYLLECYLVYCICFLLYCLAVMAVVIAVVVVVVGGLVVVKLVMYDELNEVIEYLF